MGVYSCRRRTEIDGIKHEFIIEVPNKWLVVVINESVKNYLLVRDISSTVVEAVSSSTQLQSLINDGTLVSY